MKHIIQYNQFIGEEDFLSLEEDKYKYAIVSGTNSGKTTYIIEKLKKENHPFIFLVDTIALGLNLSKKFAIPFHYSGNKVEIETKQVITLYNHLGFFYSESNMNRIIIIDEVHSLITARRYRKEHILDLISELSYYDKIIGLTGTFIHSQWFDSFTIFQCEREKPVIPVNLVRYSDSVTKVVDLTKVAIENGNQVFIYLQSKSISGDYGKLIATLRENGINSISVINSETIKDETDFEGAKDIVEQEYFKTQVLISTYSQGYSLNNENVTYIGFPGINYIDVVQSIARLRKSSVSVNLLSNANNSTGEFLVETKNLFNSILSNCRKEQKEAFALMKSEKHFERIIQQKTVSRYFQNAYTIDTNLIALDVTQSISDAMQYNFGLLQSMLQYYGFYITSLENTLTEIKISADKSAKESKQQRIREQCSVMFTLLENKVTLPSHILPLFQQYKQLCEIMPDSEAKTFMLDKYHRTTKLAMEEIFLRGYFASPEKLAYKHLKLLVLNNFKSGETYTLNEVKETMQKFAKECDVQIRPSKEISTLGCILEIRELSKRHENKVIKVIVIK